MTNSGTIILIEDDKEDADIFRTIITESFSTHELKVFESLERVFDLLNKGTEKPFIIICDNNWRNRNQNKFCELIKKFPDVKLKSIPFIFYSANPEDEQVTEAYEDLNVQGYFQKHSNYQQIRDELKTIISYWERSVMPVAGV